MQASEAALRQAGMHHSAGDFERLLRRFLQGRRGRLQGREPAAPTSQLPEGEDPMALPRRQRPGAGARRIPGLHMSARTRQD